MTKINISILAIIFVFINHTYSQNKIKQTLIGEWIGAEFSGDSILMHFNSDNSMFMSSKNNTMGKGETNLGGKMVKSLMRFELNLKETPVII
jgi:hypothetical protein